MLKLWASGDRSKSTLTYIPPDEYFDLRIYDYSFLGSDFAKRLLYDCSGGLKVINYETFLRPNGLYISPKEISSGAKNVLCMYSRSNKDGFIYNMLWCGDNCNPYIAEVVKDKDVEAFSSRIYDPYECIEDTPMTVQIMETGDIVTSSHDYMSVVIRHKLWKDI